MRVVNGSIIATMLGEIMGRGARYLLKHLVMTKSIALDCFKPVATGKEIELERGGCAMWLMSGTLCWLGSYSTIKGNRLSGQPSFLSFSLSKRYAGAGG